MGMGLALGTFVKNCLSVDLGTISATVSIGIGQLYLPIGRFFKTQWDFVTCRFLKIHLNNH